MSNRHLSNQEESNQLKKRIYDTELIFFNEKFLGSDSSDLCKVSLEELFMIEDAGLTTRVKFEDSQGLGSKMGKLASKQFKNPFVKVEKSKNRHSKPMKNHKESTFVTLRETGTGFGSRFSKIGVNQAPKLSKNGSLLDRVTRVRA